MTKHRGQTYRPRLLASAAVVFATIGMAPALAQDVRSVTISLQSQDLGAALNALALQTNTQIVFRPELVSGKHTEPLSGALTTEEALGRLLRGTGLTYNLSGARAYTILVQATDARPIETGPPIQRPVQFSLRGIEDSELIITGSRITRPGYAAPTPVTSVSRADLLARAPTNLNEITRDLPQLTPNENTNNNRGFPGSSNPNLRNLGAMRTLVLLDGQRLTPSQATGAIDVTAIPTALVSRIDVVTGGASAAYGSDAVAGVMNIFLDTKFTGVKATFQAGQSAYGDYKNYLASTAFGGTFGGEKGHIVAGAEWTRNLGVTQTSRRDWGNDRWGLIPNPAYVAGNTVGNTRLVLVPNVSLAQATDGGVINGVNKTGPLAGIQFGQNGALLPFTYGQYWSNSSTFHAGVPGASFSEHIGIAAPQRRYDGLLNVEYDFSDKLTGFANVMYINREGHLSSISNYNSSGATAVTIKRDNPFIPAALLNTMIVNNITQFTMGRTNIDGINPDSDSIAYGTAVSTQESTRSIAGLRGKLNDIWTWDASAQYGKTDFTQSVLNDRIEANYQKAIDAVLNPTTGQPICRVNLTTVTDPECVPINLIGLNTISAGAGKYVYATSRAWGAYKRTGAAADVQGELFNLPAGPIAIATGAEIRKDEMLFDADPISKALGYRTNNQGLSEGEYTIWEAYGEADVPLIKDAPFTQVLSLNGAARYTHYSTSGGVTTWKVGANWKPVDDLRFRAVVSRDIRAPSLYELFQGRTALFNSVNDPVTNTNSIVRSVTVGNPMLVPETGTTYSAGVVLQPSWFRNFQASVDYYELELDGAIETATPQNIINFCAAGQTAYCALVTRSAGNTISQITASPLNTGAVETHGWDFDTVYWFRLAGGTLGVHGLVNYTPSRVTTTSGITIENAGSIGSPKWSGNGSLTWRNDKWRLLGQVIRIDGGVRDPTYVNGVDIAEADNHVDAEYFTNVSASYSVTERVEFFSKVDNLLNVDPPITPSTVIGDQQASAAQFDAIGRRWVVGVRMSY